MTRAPIHRAIRQLLASRQAASKQSGSFASSTCQHLPRSRTASTHATTRPQPRSQTSILLWTALCFTGAYALVVRTPLLADAHTTSARTDPGPLKQDLLPDSEEAFAGGERYATQEEIEIAIKLLRGNFRDDQVTTNPDELLAHGHSANTYHCEFYLVLDSLGGAQRASLRPPAAAIPQVVVYAESTQDVSEAIKIAYKYRIPVTPFSGGTSLEGHITCPFGGMCIDLSRMDQITEIHAEDSDAVVQAGVQWEALNEELRERGLGLFFPLDPGPSACIGGMMATGCR